MKLYSVVSDAFEDGEEYHGTKRAALAAYREITDGTPATLVEHEIGQSLTGRRLLAALANRRGFASSSRELASK